MADLQDTVEINKPIEEVFSFFTHIENSLEVMSNVTKVTLLTEGPLQVGSKFEETRNIRGKEATAVIEVIELDAPNRYGVKSDSNGLTVTYHYYFRPTLDNTTKVSFEGKIKTSGLRMLLSKPVIRKILQKEDGEHLRTLKELLEKKADRE
ncbi:MULTISPECIES: SRPBCC family protein [Bacillus]|uniref:SRPBCC family protein n=1 Tax=Bacillus TaxID=1386 RepID=UPI000BB67775|nr:MULTISPECIES: SRPBCC family protein [Bacillus]